MSWLVSASSLPAVGTPPTVALSAGFPATGTGGSARRTLSVLTPVAAAMTRRLAPPTRRLLMSVTTTSVSRDGPLGSVLAGTSAPAPHPVNVLAQRRSVSGSTPNPAATRTALAALIHTSCTAANRRHTSSPGSEAMDSSPWRKTRPRSRAPPGLLPRRSGLHRRAEPAIAASELSLLSSSPPSNIQPNNRKDYLTPGHKCSHHNRRIRRSHD